MKFLAVALLATICTAANAQNSDLFPYGKNHITVSYNDIKVKGNDGTDSSLDKSSLGGVTVGYDRWFSISKQLPLFVTVGGRLRYADVNDTEKAAVEGGEWVKIADMTFSLYTLEIPVNIGYELALGTSGFSIAPYAGLSIQYHLKGEVKDEMENTKVDIFDQDKVKAHRFQPGWQVGIHACYKHITAGVSYGKPFHDLMDDLVKTQNLSFTLGYRF